MVVVLTTSGAADDEVIRIACCGDSITRGVGSDKPYSEILQDLLGDRFEVQNFGSDASTLLSGGSKPYVTQPECKAAVAFDPACVVIMLGTNDSKSETWQHSKNLQADLRALISEFRSRRTSPRIFVCSPPIVSTGAWGIDPGRLQTNVVPKLRSASKTLRLEYIDVNAAFEGKQAMWYNGVHLNNAGAELVAETVSTAILTSLEKAKAR